MMTVKKIIVAYDGSPDSKKALAIAADFARDFTAKIVLVSVYDIPIVLAEETDYIWEKFNTEQVQFGKKYCEERGVEVYTEELQGNPVEEIIKYAKREHADMIIAGTHGLGGFARLLLGSVAHQLVTYSDITVLIVK